MGARSFCTTRGSLARLLRSPLAPHRYRASRGSRTLNPFALSFASTSARCQRPQGATPALISHLSSWSLELSLPSSFFPALAPCFWLGAFRNEAIFSSEGTIIIIIPWRLHPLSSKNFTVLQLSPGPHPRPRTHKLQLQLQVVPGFIYSAIRISQATSTRKLTIELTTLDALETGSAQVRDAGGAVRACLKFAYRIGMFGESLRECARLGSIDHNERK